MAERTVLVTGAGGYVGSVLVRALLDAGFRVRALDRFYFGDTLAHLTKDPRLELVRADVRDVSADAFAGVWAVLDLAALSNDPTGDLDPELTRAINHLGRVRVASAAREAGVERYVLSSSCSVYGTADEAEVTEEHPPNPLTVYAKANLAAERDTLALSAPGFTPTALRNATVFGVSPRMRFDLVINIMTLHAYEKGRITVLGGGRQWRPLVHVTDVARAFLTVLDAAPAVVDRQVFNVGHANFRVRTIAAIIREVLPIQVVVETAPDDADKRDYSVSFAKAREVLGLAPAVTPEDGIREVYEALKYGTIEPSRRTTTAAWYRALLEAKSLVDSLTLGGRLL